MKKAKNQKKTEEVSNTGFRLKITNLRTAAYPGPLEQTDYLGMKVGDYVTKGSENTVYQVVQLQREGITDQEYARWASRCLSNKKAKDLIDEYKKNSNFGACYVAVKPIIRGGKEVAKGRIVRFNEMDSLLYHRGTYQVVTLEQLIANRTANINSIEWNLNKWLAKKNIQVKARDVIQAYIDKLNPPQAVSTPIEVAATIEVRDEKGQVVHKFDPQLLV